MMAILEGFPLIVALLMRFSIVPFKGDEAEEKRQLLKLCFSLLKNINSSF